jgi:hypothetical protein
VIPDTVVFPKEFPSPDNRQPEMRDLDDLHFAEILYQTLIGTGDLSSEKIRKHIWFHDLSIYESDTGLEVEKQIYNCFDESILLRTQDIDYSRISNVE